MIVDILDIGSGNIQSIQNWIHRVNVPTRIVTKATEIKSDFLILPGVGSAGSYMDRLQKGNFDQAIREHVNNNKRLLGICLGFQIMGQHTEEDGGVECLGLLNGVVTKLIDNSSHNGWEKFSYKKNQFPNSNFHSQLNLTKKQNINGRVFFNHEYGFVNNDPNVFSKPISSDLQPYSSVIVKNNIIGIQFHPEKSQNTGIELASMIL